MTVAYRITAVRKRPRSKLVEVICEGRALIALNADLAVQHGLRPGRSLSASELKRLRAEQREASVFERALRLIASRPRSERELCERLSERCRSEAVIAAGVRRLRELGLVDDAAFAQSWAENRDRASPRSARMIASELRQKGIARETADIAAAIVDDVEAAYRAGVRRASSMRSLDYADFQQRLGNFILRRGFTYEVAGETVKRLWLEVRA